MTLYRIHTKNYILLIALAQQQAVTRNAAQFNHTVQRKGLTGNIAKN